MILTQNESNEFMICGVKFYDLSLYQDLMFVHDQFYGILRCLKKYINSSLIKRKKKLNELVEDANKDLNKINKKLDFNGDVAGDLLQMIFDDAYILGEYLSDIEYLIDIDELLFSRNDKTLLRVKNLLVKFYGKFNNLTT